MKSFDLIIIGGGAAGFAAAIKADGLGAKTLLVNSGLPMGGTCVNVGCVPTKYLLETTSDYYKANHSRFSSVSSKAKINFPRLIKEKDRLVRALRQSNYKSVLDNLPNVTYIEGEAQFISKDEVKIDNKIFRASKFIIATGSSTKVVSIEGLKEAGFLTNQTALKLKKVPKSLLVIGAGPIGLEFGQIFSRLGSKVTVVEMMENILPKLDPVISEELRECLEVEGIRIITSARIRKIEKNKIAWIEKNKKIVHIETEEILLASGVAGNSRGLGLEDLGVRLDKDGFIKVNKYLQTANPHIFAAGDVIGPPLLETVAAKEGNIAAQNALLGYKIKMDYTNIPYAVFGSPQVACVGMKESEYMKKYGTCLCRTINMDRVPKARVIKETKGLIHMVIHHKTKRIMGVHIVSNLASEIIHEAALAIRYGLTIDEIIDTLHVFPTFSEAIKISSQSFKHDPKRMSCCVE